MAFPVPTRRQGIDRVELMPCRQQRSNQRAAVRLNADYDLPALPPRQG